MEFSLGEPLRKQRARSTRLKKSCTSWESTSPPFAHKSSRISENTSLNWRAGSHIGRTTERMLTMTRIGMTKIGRSSLADLEHASAQESGRQKLALCVARLLSQLAFCGSTTGDRIIQTRTRW